jgi:hypothetical protein
MIITIHQPDFLPWLGFFDRWLKSDLYIVLDDVQFIRRGWHHRDRIKTPQGVKWLTVPVCKKGRFHQQIKDVEIDNVVRWRRRHLNTLRSSYGKAPNFNAVFHLVEDIFRRNHKFLIELNIDLLDCLSGFMKIDTPYIFSSSFKTSSKGTDKLVQLVKAVGGRFYLTGKGAKDYLDVSAFHKEGIQVLWQDFNHPVYPQLYGSFEPMLSVLDSLMMFGEPENLLRAHINAVKNVVKP